MLKRIVVVIVTVGLGVIFTGAALAQTQISLNGAGIKLGFVDPEVSGAVIGFGALADLGTLTPDIMLEANLDYWSKSFGSSSANSVKFSFSDLIVGGTAKYLFKNANPKLLPFASGGLAFHFFKTALESSSPLLDDGSNTELKIGIHVGGGLFYNLSPQLDLLADTRYTIVADVSQFALQAGVLYKLSK